MLEKPFFFKVNENGGGPHLLLQVFSERGWVECKEEGAIKDKWNLWWKTSCIPGPNSKSLKAWQFVNRIPEAQSICRKDHLARSLKTMRALFGSLYEFSPTTFILPIDYTKLVTQSSHLRYSGDGQETIWICKPVGRSQGRGITVFRKASELMCERYSSVVQEYIKNPLLIGGYKFDLRLYVCVPSFHPLTVYIYREGLARFGTNKFSLAELDNRCAHLTNSSINKHSPGYLELKDKVGQGCKWSLRQLRMYMEQNGLDDWLLWQRIANIVVLTIASQLSGVPSTTNCFEFYGFDILIDSYLKPWLIEVNNSPALCWDCDLDPAIKKPMLHDLLDLLGLPMCNTGLSILDWSDHFLGDDRDDSADDESSSFTTTARTAVAIIKFKNRWKNQIQPPHSKGSHNTSSRESRHFKSSDRGLNSTYPKRCSNRRGDKVKKSYKEKADCKWENGLDWEEAPSGGGDWVRVYPFLAGSLKTLPDTQANRQKESRMVVVDVARASRIARTIAARYTMNLDEPRDEALMNNYTQMEAVWHPSRR